MKLAVTTNQKAFADNLVAYANQSSKGRGAALNDQAMEFSRELFNQFHTIRPQPNTGRFDATAIFLSAKARGYRTFRRSSFLSPAVGGLSAKAVASAQAMLGGKKSDFFGRNLSGLFPVKFSRRKGNDIVKSANIFRSRKNPLLTAAELEPERQASFAEEKKALGIVRLNFRALATYLELIYRRRGAIGGVMAVQWLFKQWRKARRFDPSSGNARLLPTAEQRPAELVQRTAKHGVRIGEVSFDMSAQGLQGVTLKGFVPGTAAEAARHGLINKAFAARAADLLTAISNAERKAAKARGLHP